MAAAAGTGRYAGYSLLYTDADLAALTPATIDDFAVGLEYNIPLKVGQKNTGTDEAPVWEDQYELKPITVTAENINLDLLDFQMYLNRGEAYIIAAG